LFFDQTFDEQINQYLKDHPSPTDPTRGEFTRLLPSRQYKSNPRQTPVALMLGVAVCCSADMETVFSPQMH